MQERDRDIVDDSPTADEARRTRQETHIPQSGTQGRESTSQKATEFTEQARDRTDEGMNKAAGTLEDTASKLRERSENMGGVQAKAGERLAEGAEKTAGYLREKDTQQIMDDVEKYVKEHPVQAIGAAVLGGFVIARILR